MKKFGRESAHRAAMLKNLCVSLIKNNCLETTLAKAKDLKRVMDKLITRAKRGNTLHNRRILMKKLYESRVNTTENGENKYVGIVDQLFTIASQYQKRTSGYISLLKCGIRSSDCSQMARIEILKDV
jgi:large subunit ribosomal protein L17